MHYYFFSVVRDVRVAITAQTNASKGYVHHLISEIIIGNPPNLWLYLDVVMYTMDYGFLHSYFLVKLIICNWLYFNWTFWMSTPCIMSILIMLDCIFVVKWCLYLFKWMLHKPNLSLCCLIWCVILGYESYMSDII